MPPSITSQQACAWRMRRQLLDPPGGLTVARVVAHLCGVQVQVASSAELAVRVRREKSRPGEVAHALADGRILKTWAMRGTLHLLSPEDGAASLSVLAPERVWTSWRRYFGTTTKQMDALWRTICEVLQGEPLSRDEFADAVATRRGLGFARSALLSSYGEILRPLAWSGELCFGPVRDGRVTFTSPRVNPRWPGLTNADEAAPKVIAAYMRVYGPATFDNLAAWLGNAVDKRRLKGWFRALGDRLAEVDVDGRPAYVVARDLDELVSTKPSGTLRLLPAFDQYVLGLGTKDPLVVPPARRAAISRRSGWIAPLVLVDGAIRGTWQLERDEVRIAWFAEAGRPPKAMISAEVARLATIVGRDLRTEVLSESIA